MSSDLTFSVMVDSALNEAQLIEELSRCIGQTERVGGYVKYMGNVIKVEKNTLYNESKVRAQSDNSWMYFQFSLSVFPEVDTSLDMQKRAASELLAALRNVGMVVELVAEFYI